MSAIPEQAPPPVKHNHGGLVRGGSGEIALRDILPPLSFVTRGRVEQIARDYEDAHPGVVVVCDWELFSDADVSAMDPAQAALALRDRAKLAARRAAAAEVPPPPEVDRAGDPERFAEQLRRVQRDITLLDVRHPDYVRMFKDMTNQANRIEDAMGVARTSYRLGDKIAAAPRENLTAERKRDLETRAKGYLNLPVPNRRASIAEMTDQALLRMLLDAEKEESLREMVVMKLFALGAAA